MYNEFRFLISVLVAIFGAWNGEVSDEVHVAKSLLNAFAHDEETVKGLAAADKSVRSFPFDQFDEKLLCQVSQGIHLKDFGTIIDNFADTVNISNHTKSSLSQGVLIDKNYEAITLFNFSKGEGGNVTFGRIVTVRHGDMIDMAYAVYFLNFKLSPLVIEHTKKNKFLIFTIGREVWHETKERDISIEERNDFEMYFMEKAAQGFKKQYAGLIEEHSSNTHFVLLLFLLAVFKKATLG